MFLLILFQVCWSPISANTGCIAGFWGRQKPSHSEKQSQGKHTADLQPVMVNIHYITNYMLLCRKVQGKIFCWQQSWRNSDKPRTAERSDSVNGSALHLLEWGACCHPSLSSCSPPTEHQHPHRTGCTYESKFMSCCSIPQKVFVYPIEHLNQLIDYMSP